MLKKKPETAAQGEQIQQVPVAERPLVPVVRTAPGGSVVWVGGIRLDDRFKCTAASKVLVKLVIHPQDLAL